MYFEFYSGNNGVIESVSIDMSKLDKSLCNYLKNSSINDINIINDKIIIKTCIKPDVLESLNIGLSECIYKYVLDNVINANLSKNYVNVTLDNDMISKNDNIESVTKQPELIENTKNRSYIDDSNNILQLIKNKESISMHDISSTLNLTTEYTSNILNNYRKQGIITYKIIVDERLYKIK